MVSLIPSTHVKELTTTCNSSFGRGYRWKDPTTLASEGTDTHMHIPTYIYIIKRNDKIYLDFKKGIGSFSIGTKENKVEFYLKVGAIATWRRQSEQYKMGTQNKSKPSSHYICKNKLQIVKCSNVILISNLP